MKAKTKYTILKIAMIFISIINIFFISGIFVLCKVDYLWDGMFENGIDNFSQWISLIIYRILIYVPIPLIFGIFKFDKRTKYLTRITIWYNWMFLVYLIFYGVYEILALNLIFDVGIFNTLSSFVLVLGYLFTYIAKKPISFDEPKNIINKY